jgi:hypothetical protein
MMLHQFNLSLALIDQLSVREHHRLLLQGRLLHLLVLFNGLLVLLECCGLARLPLNVIYE